MKMTNNEIEAIKTDLANILADWYLDKNIDKYYDILCKRILQLNEFIDSVSDEKKGLEGYHEVIELCYQFYRFKDEATG